MFDNTSPKNKTCSACGTSPVNHRFMFVSSALDEIVDVLNNFFLKNISSSKWWQRASDLIEKAIFNTFHFIGLARFEKDTKKALNGRSKLIWEEARRRGIPMEQIVVGGRNTDHYRAKIMGKNYYFQSLPIPPHIPQKGYSWIDDKFKLAEKLKEHHIPAPESRIARTWGDALFAFKALQKPLIIKPKYGSRGRHTTTNINTVEELKEAFSLAKVISPSLVVQEHLSGSVYRATVIDGKLVGFFRADPPNVLGDGKNSIAKLIESKNKNRHERISAISISDETINFLKRQDHSLEGIPKKGEIVNLSAKTGRMYGGYTKEMLPWVHPKMHGIFEKAGELASAPVLGFDLIIGDATKDPDFERWGIIECNSLPFIDLHYFALEGEPIDLAKNVWDLWDKK